MTCLLAGVSACGGSGDTGPSEPPPSDFVLRVAAGGNNVLDRYTSDLWVHGDHAYTGTWGGSARGGKRGNVVKIWRLDAAGAPSLADSLVVPGSTAGTVSDVEVTDDGAVLMFGRERVAEGGVYFYSLADPEKPTPLDFVPVASGVHTATFGYIGGRRYAFAVRNAPEPALQIYDATDPANVVPAASVPVPPTFGIHDTFVRDGIAFLFAWDTGVIILDVGNGIRGGRPESPVEVSRIAIPGGAAHNGWWFHDPSSGQRRYLFVGQEGPGFIGSTSSGDIHVLDVSDLAQPVEVATFHLEDAGTHNFWMDEERGILYAAYYNAGVVALDVTGELAGDLGSRELGRIRPGGASGTYTWGVMLANGFLYASDMLSGLWQLAVDEAL
jgi:hypothetical protein